ncbi:MAG TPA: AMP-binding protein, partial [Enteractinococcus sp.]
SVGRAFDGASLKIVDEDGHEQPTGERGEILLRGPGIVAGYWQNADETSNVFLDGWLKTGDVGFVDEDSWLYIVDRTKNMIVASGYKVWPREVEDVLYQVPGIHEAAVVGVPDDYRGETVVAAVSLSDPDKRANWDEFEEQLRQHCKKHLANYKVPSRFIVKNDLPKNFNGKIQHREIVAEIAPQ